MHCWLLGLFTRVLQEMPQDSRPLRYHAAAKYSCPSKNYVKERIDDSIKTPLVDLEASHCAFYSELTAEHGHSLTLG